MAERRYSGRRGDARGSGRGWGHRDLPNEEAARQHDLRDIGNDDLRQQVRDLQRDIENGYLRQQVRDLQRRLARLEEHRGKSNTMRSNVPERRSMVDPLFSDVFTSSVVDETSKNTNSNIFSMPVYDTPVYDEDIFYELPGLASKSPSPSVKFDDVAEDEGVVVYDDEEDDEAEGENRLLGFMFKNGNGADDLPREKAEFRKNDVAANQEDVMEKLVKETFVSKAAGDSYVINTKKNFDYEFDAIKDEVDVQVGFGILDLDPVKEFGFVGQEFDGYPNRMMHDNQNWNWFVKEEVRDGEDDDDRDKADSRIDSRTSLFQEGEYDAVIKDKSWRLRKIYIWFYLFPS